MLKQKLFLFIQGLKNEIFKRGEASKHQFFIFGIFGFISYPLYYILWILTNPSSYENLPLRIGASILCVPLIIQNYLPGNIKKLLPAYWYLLLIYCLPFFFTFMLFKNNLSTTWLLNTMSALVWAVLLTDTVSLLIINSLGIPLGFLAYKLTTSKVYVPGSYFDIVFMFASVFVFSSIFSIKKERSQKEKLQVMKTLAATIAHELRTPLTSLNMSVRIVRDKIIALLKKVTNDDNASNDVFTAREYQATERELAVMNKEIRASFTFIDMLLLNLNPTIDKAKIEVFSISKCIDEALSRYPFNGDQQKLVSWVKNEEHDFAVRGEPLLLIHVLFNLLKNAIYYVEKAGEGGIQLWLERGDPYNRLYFKDTGTGIPASFLPHIFDRFFSKTYHGAGVGLTFCQWVMESLGGKITCESVEGSYTLFMLGFPNAENTNPKRLGQASGKSVLPGI